MSGYVKEINSLDAEIKRTNVHLKAMRLQKRAAQTHLYNYMISHNLEVIGEGKNAITLKKCAPPKPRAKAKPKKEKREDALRLFQEAGIPNPDTFYNEFEKTQKNNIAEDNSDAVTSDPNSMTITTKIGKRKNVTDFDEMLGF